VSQSYERAAELLKQAASKGHAGGQACLGYLYRNGLGVPQSYERAAELYQHAVSQGHAGAQACLGGLYRDGLGVSQSYERAAELYQQAVSQGLRAGHNQGARRPRPDRGPDRGRATGNWCGMSGSVWQCG
jgi:TPR repeat protein